MTTEERIQGLVLAYRAGDVDTSNRIRQEQLDEEEAMRRFQNVEDDCLGDPQLARLGGQAQ